MKRYKKITFSGSAGERALVDATRDIGRKDRMIHAVWVHQGNNSAFNNGLTFLVVKNNDEILEIDNTQFSVGNTSSGQDYNDVPNRVSIDMEVKEGDEFRVGGTHATASFAGQFTIEYSDKEDRR